MTIVKKARKAFSGCKDRIEGEVGSIILPKYIYKPFKLAILGAYNRHVNKLLEVMTQLDAKLKMQYPDGRYAWSGGVNSIVHNDEIYLQLCTSDADIVWKALHQSRKPFWRRPPYKSIKPVKTVGSVKIWMEDHLTIGFQDVKHSISWDIAAGMGNVAKIREVPLAIKLLDLLNEVPWDAKSGGHIIRTSQNKEGSDTTKIIRVYGPKASRTFKPVVEEVADAVN